MTQIEFLNKLLATLEVVAANVKGRHWTVYGMSFRSVHLLLDDVYDVLRNGADKAAETVRVLGGIPLRSLTSFVANSYLSEDAEIAPAADMVESTIEEVAIIIGHINGAIEAGILDPTTENDVAALSSELRHYCIFLDGMSETWEEYEPITMGK